MAAVQAETQSEDVRRSCFERLQFAPTKSAQHLPLQSQLLPLSLWVGCHDLSKCNTDSLLLRKKDPDYSPEYVQQASLLSLHLKTACG